MLNLKVTTHLYSLSVNYHWCLLPCVTHVVDRKWVGGEIIQAVTEIYNKSTKDMEK